MHPLLLYVHRLILFPTRHLTEMTYRLTLSRLGIESKAWMAVDSDARFGTGHAQSRAS